MTKERKLAIEMWKGIRDGIQNSFVKDDGFSVTTYKENFCKDRNLNWRNDCWFCQYIKECSKCPLGYCNDSGTLYYTVNNNWNTLHTRIEACDKIIATLNGNVYE